MFFKVIISKKTTIQLQNSAHKVMGYLDTFSEVIRGQPVEEISKVRGLLLNDGNLQQGRQEN